MGKDVADAFPEARYVFAASTIRWALRAVLVLRRPADDLTYLQCGRRSFHGAAGAVAPTGRRRVRAAAAIRSRVQRTCGGSFAVDSGARLVLRAGADVERGVQRRGTMAAVLAAHTADRGRFASTSRD